MKNELGYYLVNGKQYFNKIEAVLEAQKTLADITWNFHKDSFDKIDWTVEPNFSLDMMYKMRAQQIRDEYDYVVVTCSGGADSTNVIKSFLNNGIHIDEIVAGAPMSGLNNWNWNDSDSSVENTISETKYALFPLLNEIKTNFPNIKINIHDYFEDILNLETDKWIYDCLDWVNPVVNSKASLDKFKHLVNLAESGKRIAVVWGIDKPILRYGENGDLYSLISDLAINNAHLPFKRPYSNVDRILFYWTPDFPQLLVKQSHVVAKFIHQKENAWLSDSIKILGKNNPLFVKPNNLNESQSPKNDYQRGIIPAIYPTTYENVFQCKKMNGSFMPGQHRWIEILHKDTRICQLVDSDFRSFYKNINRKYLNANGNGFKIFKQTYNIGHYSQFLINQDK